MGDKGACTQIQRCTCNHIHTVTYVIRISDLWFSFMIPPQDKTSPDRNPGLDGLVLDLFTLGPLDGA